MDDSLFSDTPQDVEPRPTFSYDTDSAAGPAPGPAPDSSSISAAAELAQRGTAPQPPPAGTAATAPLAGSGSAMPPLGGSGSAMPPLAGSGTTRPDYGGRLKARSPQFEEQTSSVPGELARAEVAALRAEAFERAKLTHSPERLTEWLVKKGLPEDEAKTMSATAWGKAQNWRQSQIARQTAAANQKKYENGLAALEIVAGFVLLGVGLAAGWFVGLFLVPIIDGFRRLG